MALVPLIRLVALSLVSVFAVIVLGLTAGLTSLTETYLGGYFQFAALGIATASLTLLTVPAMIALEIIRPGGFTSQIIVELPWLSVLWVLWLATAADATNVANNIFIASCGDYFSDKIAQGCRETSAVQGLAYVTWVILFGYTIFILSLSITAASRQQPGVWRSSVAEAPFFAGAPAAAGDVPPATSQTAGTTGVSYGGSAPGGTDEPASMGGAGPTSVQAGTVHQIV